MASSGGVPRLAAAAIDHTILTSVDLAVIYFTLRTVGLPFDDWTRLPAVPMIAFLVCLKLGYFSAFTCLGGQTIGKMATGIRVVTHDNRAMAPEHALRRALAGIASVVTFGAGFVPAIIGSDHLALHDRLTHTRVVARSS